MRPWATCCLMFVSVAFSCTGCATVGPINRAEGPPYEVLKNVGDKVSSLGPDASESDVLRTLGLDSYKGYMMLHSLGASDFEAFTRRYSFPSFPRYELVISTGPKGEATNVEFRRGADSIQWKLLR